MFISIDSLTVDADNVSRNIDHELIPYIANACSISQKDVISYTIVRRSLDARKKPKVKIMYRLTVELKDGTFPRNAKPEEVQNKPLWLPPENARVKYPLIVGAGPAGLFAAYALALAGCHPVILERGYDVERRRTDVDSFLSSRKLNPESNFLYGEGGAGTWSDGKLYTRIHDPASAFVLKTFTECGADPSILYFSHPHIGSDCLPSVISALRKKIIALGGEFRWGTCVKSVKIVNGVCVGAVLSSGEFIEGSRVLLAAGHGSRSFIRELTGSGVQYSMKGFQIGVRMEHPQSFINNQQYGKAASFPALGAAEYNYCSRPSPDGAIRGAVTFCMCPGGEVIPASCDPERLCTNGMSESARAGVFANSALVTEIPAGSFATPDAAFEFLDRIEEKAFICGGSDYTAPAQSISGFLSGKTGRLPENTSYRLGLQSARIDQLLPQEPCKALKRALGFFDKTMKGFADNGTLIGVETHVSSPVRFERDRETLCSSIPGLYIGGEGAGMAGGIISAAVDGLNIAAAMCGRGTK